MACSARSCAGELANYMWAEYSHARIVHQSVEGDMLVIRTDGDESAYGRRHARQGF
jgi:hypothetical protein